MLNCRELDTEQEWRKAALILQEELEPSLDTEVFVATLHKICPKECHVFGAFRGTQLVSVACVHKISVTSGIRVLWIFAMATSQEQRSIGVGRELVSFIENFGRTHGFDQLRLHSKNHRERAHDFWETKCGFSSVWVTFNKNLR